MDKNVIKSTKNNQINNFNINIFTPNVQFPLNQLNLEEQNANLYKIKKEHENENEKEVEDFNDSYISNKVNNEISFSKDFIMNIKDNNIKMDNIDENSNIFFFNKKIKENINISDNSNIVKLLNKSNFDKKQIIEKAEIKTNDILNITSDKSEINKNNKSDDIPIQIIKINNFSNLNTTQSTSFSIKSIYKNINRISQYKYEKNLDLREKTEKFILEQINVDNNRPTFSKTAKNNYNLLDIKKDTNIESISKNSLARQNSENSKKSNISNKNIINIHKRATLQFNESKINGLISPKKSLKKIERYTITPKNMNEDRLKSGKRFLSVINKKRNSKKKGKEEDMKQIENKHSIIK